MGAVPQDYLERKLEDAYALMLKKNHVNSGVERLLRDAYDEAVDAESLAESLDHAVELEIEQRLRQAFLAALGRAAQAWEPPHVVAVVDFLAAGPSGEWETVGSDGADLDGYVGRLPLSDLREMAEDWGRFAEEVGYDLAMGGYVTAPPGWTLAVCRRPEGLEGYIGEMEPAGR